MNSTFTAADGLQLAYYVDDFTDPWRKPDTVLLLHAAMGNSRRWFQWVPPLSRHYRVVRLDLRGHGNSQVPKPTVTFHSRCWCPMPWPCSTWSEPIVRTSSAIRPADMYRSNWR